MKVLLVNGSSHAHGTTARALDEMIGVFQAAGVETEVIQLGGSPIADCLQCGKCAELGRCVIDGDGVNAFVEKAKEADGFVFATPTYYAHPSGRIFSFLDRVFFSNSDVFMFKPGAAVAVARRAGTTAALDALNKYFGISQMPAVDAEEDLEGLQTMRNLARNMIWMMRCFELGQMNGIPYPETEWDAKTNFVR